MYKDTIGILVPNCSCNSSIMAVRASYGHCADDYRTIVVISGKQDMKNNIIEVAKARLNT